MIEGIWKGRFSVRSKYWSTLTVPAGSAVLRTSVWVAPVDRSETPVMRAGRSNTLSGGAEYESCLKKTKRYQTENKTNALTD